jgi:16S rRNA C967 or C1407 C5-methylase (RsmB/RsmF family)
VIAMEEDFENMIRSQLRILKNQMDIIKGYIDSYEEKSAKLRKTITEELITALLGRFERNEKLITELNEKVDSINFKFQDSLSKSMKDLREEISEAALAKAIAKISEEKEIRVNSRALDELKDI